VSEMISWLRSTIEGDKAAARTLPHGPWHREGVYPQEISNAEAIVIAATYTNPSFPPDIADHIIRHDPQDTIARCESELALLDKVDEAGRGLKEALAEEDKMDVLLFTAALGAFMLAAKALAKGRRHRPGFNPEWVAE